VTHSKTYYTRVRNWHAVKRVFSYTYTHTHKHTHTHTHTHTYAHTRARARAYTSALREAFHNLTTFWNMMLSGWVQWRHSKIIRNKLQNVSTHSNYTVITGEQYTLHTDWQTKLPLFKSLSSLNWINAGYKIPCYWPVSLASWTQSAPLTSALSHILLSTPPSRALCSRTVFLLCIRPTVQTPVYSKNPKYFSLTRKIKDGVIHLGTQKLTPCNNHTTYTLANIPTANDSMFTSANGELK
jgi:hypothetical protein